MSTYLTLGFEDGPPLHDNIAAGWGDYSNAVANYPNMVEALYVDVLAGAGTGGGAGLGEITGEGYDIDDSYLVYAVMAPYPTWALTPLADAGKGRVQFDIIFSASRMGVVGGYEWSLLSLNGGYFDATPQSILCLSNAGHTEGAFNWMLTWWATAGGAHENPSFPTATFRKVVSAGDYADLVDGNTHTIEMTWQCGTLAEWLSSTDMTVAADGWIKLKVDGVTVIHEQNIPLVINVYGDAAGYGAPNRSQANVNRFTSIDIGAWNGGLPGVFDNIIVGTPLTETWVDIPDWHAQEWINASQYPGGVARCLCDLWTTASGVMVKARLVSLLADGSVDAVVGTSAEITATTPTDATFAVALTGNKQHKLQLTSDTPNTDLWCSPDAKVTA